MKSIIILFCLFGLTLCIPYSSELEGLNGQQDQDQPQQQQQQDGDRVREEAVRRRLAEKLGRTVENEEETAAAAPAPARRAEAIVILRPVSQQQTESELYDGQDHSAAPGVLLPHHTRSHKLAARYAVRRLRIIPVQVQEQQQQQQQEQQQQSGNEEETTTPETTTTSSTTSEEPSTTTEEESTTPNTTEEESTTSSTTEEPSSSSSSSSTEEIQQQQQPQFTSDASAVLNSRTFTTFKARKNINGKEVTVLGHSMAFKSSAMNVLRPTQQRRGGDESDDADRKDETDEERREREKAEAAAKSVKIVQFSQMQTMRSSKAMITRDIPTF